ncbi:MAG TPA: helix-turn-helix domain-containing protein [Blastocatellia bacterium]|nr:helix-turn-helix domain-containing protein [Blastocatellia bacterium]
MPLQPKTYEVLLMLVENQARLITRDELMDSVWGTDVNVEEGALNYQIRQLRSVLGDVASHPRFL